MIYKSYIIEQNLNSIQNCKIVLFYGENQGLKKSFKEIIKNKEKKTEVIRLSQEDIIKNNNILNNEILNKSLFSEKKIIFIEQVNDKILNLLEKLVDAIENEKIYLFADNLEKKSKLRTYFEKDKNLGISPCYNDNELTIRKIITKELSNFSGLSNEIINLIILNTGLDRLKVLNELEKIQSCFLDKKLDFNKIEKLLNNSINDNFNELRDVALIGNKNKTNKLLSETVIEDENNVYYLSLLNHRLHKLKEFNILKNNNENYEITLSKMKPPIFWKDKEIFIQQANKWSEKNIQKALKKTFDIEIDLKSNPSIKKNLLIKNLIVDLCQEANSA